MSRETVLSLLLAHPGEYLSGAAMSRTLGVSRAAVWKAIEALRQEGYEITSAPNRGYRLESAPDRVREGELSGHLAGCLVGSRLLCLDTIDSTNTEAKRQAMAGAREGLVVLAEEQTGGRCRTAAPAVPLCFRFIAPLVRIIRRRSPSRPRSLPASIRCIRW